MEPGVRVARAGRLHSDLSADGWEEKESEERRAGLDRRTLVIKWPQAVLRFTSGARCRTLADGAPLPTKLGVGRLPEEPTVAKPPRVLEKNGPVRHPAEIHCDQSRSVTFGEPH